MSFQRACLSYIARSKSAQGFTLIELLVVVIIIGVLSAIALPSMLNQANRAREAEAKNYVGAVTRAQQVYRLEKPVFAPTMSDLEISVPTASSHYNYSFDPAPTATVAQYKASPNQAGIRAFTGCTRVISGTGTTTELVENLPSGTTPVAPLNCP